MFPAHKAAGAIAMAIAVVSGITLHHPITDAKDANKEVKKEDKVENALKYESVKWTKSTYEKRDYLVKIGMPKDVAVSLLTHCKALAKDPSHCVKVGASILGAESSLGTKCYNNNCVGMNDGKVAYKSKDEGIRVWVQKYVKYWFRQENPDGFYSNTPDRKPPTRYCMGGSAGYCKHGHKNAWAVWEKLKGKI